MEYRTILPIGTTIGITTGTTTPPPPPPKKRNRERKKEGKRSFQRLEKITLTFAILSHSLPLLTNAYKFNGILFITPHGLKDVLNLLPSDFTKKTIPNFKNLNGLEKLSLSALFCILRFEMQSERQGDKVRRMRRRRRGEGGEGGGGEGFG